MKFRTLSKHQIKDLIDTYGKENQLTVCMEEPAELVQAISKMRRYGSTGKNKDHLCEEIADTLIAAQTLMEIYEIDKKDINEWIKKKEERAERRCRAIKCQQDIAKTAAKKLEKLVKKRNRKIGGKNNA